MARLECGICFPNIYSFVCACKVDIHIWLMKLIGAEEKSIQI